MSCIWFKKSYGVIRALVAGVLQHLTRIYTIPMAHLLLRLQVIRPASLYIKKGTLIISNHQSRSDPFLIGKTMGVLNTLRNLPAHLPTTPEYMEMPIMGKCLRLLHCFSVGNDRLDRAKALIKIRDILDRGKTVLLFPEGKLILQGNFVAEFHKGLDMLLQENYPVLLVRIKNLNTWTLFHTSQRPTIEYRQLPMGLSLSEKRQLIHEFYNS